MVIEFRGSNLDKIRYRIHCLRSLGAPAFFETEREVKRLMDVDFFKKSLASQVIEKHILFIHIPKAGGTSIVKSFYGRTDWTHLTYDDYSSLFSSEVFNSLFKFTFTRNPYDRVISAHSYLKKSTKPFDIYWVRNNLDLDFSRFVETQLNKENLSRWSIDHFKPQVDFLPDASASNGGIQYLGKIEHLDKDIQKISDVLGRKLSIPHENRSSSLFDSASLTTKQKKIIQDVYREDFERFDY